MPTHSADADLDAASPREPAGIHILRPGDIKPVLEPRIDTDFHPAVARLEGSMRMMMKLGGMSLAAVMLLAGTAEALSIQVHSARRASVVQVDDNNIVFGARRGRGRASFSVSLADTGGLASISSAMETDVNVLIVKRNGRKRRFSGTLVGNDHDFNLRNHRRVVMTFATPINVPEPGTLALLGVGLGGLAVAGTQKRRRS